ncbi:hypothetical protein OIU85_000468 [Salix viminalis]|uniref:Protein FAR1-RELATED SEQUENCE n=1 Tax=Salix viminalis TaxID=40686 RepID=A0A9Q0VK30_SALVM|nr:hypothetical protein OIU85_000468 [Salix viminalis]
MEKHGRAEIQVVFSSEEAAYEFTKAMLTKLVSTSKETYSESPLMICNDNEAEMDKDARKKGEQSSNMGCIFNLTLMVTQQVFLWRDGRSEVGYDYFGDVLILGTESSSSAMKAVLPGAEHRIGIWYIRRNALNHLPALYIQPGFEIFFNKCVPDCQTEEGFDSRWESLPEQFDLPENSWLSSLYKSEMDRENSLRLVCSHRHIKWILGFLLRMMAAGALETRKLTLQKQVIMKRTG